MANPKSLDFIEGGETYRAVQIFGEGDDGNPALIGVTGGAVHSMDGFKPSQYDADLTMDGTAQSVALATGVKLGAGRVEFSNLGATTESIRIVFGTSAANAEANLNIAGGLATTGNYVGAAAEVGSESVKLRGVPALATHYAVANAVASDVQVVSVTQGV